MSQIKDIVKKLIKQGAISVHPYKLQRIQGELEKIAQPDKTESDTLTLVNTLLTTINTPYEK